MIDVASVDILVSDFHKISAARTSRWDAFSWYNGQS